MDAANKKPRSSPIEVPHSEYMKAATAPGAIMLKDIVAGNRFIGRFDSFDTLELKCAEHDSTVEHTPRQVARVERIPLAQKLSEYLNKGYVLVPDVVGKTFSQNLSAYYKRITRLTEAQFYVVQFA